VRSLRNGAGRNGAYYPFIDYHHATEHYASALPVDCKRIGEIFTTSFGLGLIITASVDVVFRPTLLLVLIVAVSSYIPSFLTSLDISLAIATHPQRPNT